MKCLLLEELSNTLMSARQILLLPIRWEFIVPVLEQNQAACSCIDYGFTFQKVQIELNFSRSLSQE